MNKNVLSIYRVDIGIFRLLFSPGPGPISSLRDFAYYFIEFIHGPHPAILSGRLPAIPPAPAVSGSGARYSIARAENIEEIIPDNNSYSLFSFLFFGLIAGTLGLLVVDYYHHDTVTNIPVIGTFVDTITSGINYA